jgi:hypothetical protein
VTVVGVTYQHVPEVFAHLSVEPSPLGERSVELRVHVSSEPTNLSSCARFPTGIESAAKPVPRMVEVTCFGVTPCDTLLVLSRISF